MLNGVGNARKIEILETIVFWFWNYWFLSRFMRQKVLKGIYQIKTIIPTRGRWNRTTRLLHLFRFAVCTPQQRRSSTLNFNYIFICIHDSGRNLRFDYYYYIAKQRQGFWGSSSYTLCSISP